MIITKTPYRVSFVGGGTDLKSFYSISEGSVISSAIDKYLYVIVKKQLGIVDFKYRINWSKVEFKNNIEEIENPIARECLRYFKIDYPIEITTFADIPAQTGLGSSSSFAVGLVNALFALSNKKVTKNEIATLAAKIEIDILNRPIGKQDHFASAYGGLNQITFKKDERVKIKKINYSKINLNKMEKRLTLFYINLKRNAEEVLLYQNKYSDEKFKTLQSIKKLVDPFKNIILKEINDDFGKLLNENWMLKKEITNNISSTYIDNIYNRAINSGAVGGKLLGAGKGGFILLYINEKKRIDVIKELSEFKYFGFKLDTEGSRISYRDKSYI